MGARHVRHRPGEREAVRRLVLLVDRRIEGRDERGVLFVDRGVPLRSTALFPNARLVLDVVALVIGREAAFDEEPVRHGGRELCRTGRVDG